MKDDKETPVTTRPNQAAIAGAGDGGVRIEEPERDKETPRTHGDSLPADDGPF